jgi:histidinol-phosphate aminotransferase
MDVEDLLAPHFRAMRPYTPIVPFDVLSKRLGIPVERIIKLDANENPYGPSPAAVKAIAECDVMHIYPDPDQAALREAIAAHIGVGSMHILCGAGGDEVIDLVARAFVQPEDAVIDCPPTFGMYKWQTDVLGARYVSVPRHADFSLDMDALEAAVQTTPNVKLLFVANPNNPDGSVLPEGALERLLALPVIVVLDEAYIDFCTQPSAVGLVKRHNNLVVLRTFSKLAGMAGLRVGYGVFPEVIIRQLWKIKQPYTPNVAGMIGATAALADTGWLQHSVTAIVAERERLRAALTGLGWLTPLPSQTNFLLCRINGNPPWRRDPLLTPGLELKQRLEKHGILVRYFDKDGLRDCIRISIGLPAQHDVVLRAFQEMSG